jgi:hypothetical protein
MSKTEVAKDPEETQPAEKLKTKDYERELAKLHVELVKLQEWVRHKGLKVCVVFEGRDGAGKGGTIKAITERVSPRVFQVVALPAPTEREKSQMYAQRYITHFPAGGEVVIFDRSYCPNNQCEHYGKPFKIGRLVCNGSSRGEPQARCQGCGSSVTWSYGTAYYGLGTDPLIFETALRALAEGNSLRATARIVGGSAGAGAGNIYG